MKLKILFTSLFALLIISAFGFVPNTKTVIAASNIGRSDLIEDPAQRAILDATVQISLYSLKENSNDDRLFFAGNGLGTVIREGDQVVIVTHDHWSRLTQKLVLVRIHDSKGNMIGELDKNRFYHLIRSRDTGTMILEAPAGVVAKTMPIDLTDSVENPKVGDQVQMVYLEPGAERRLSITTMSLASVEDHEGLPSLKLESQDGRHVQKGNSGGGIFYQGNLIGNMWKTIGYRSLIEGYDIGEITPTSESRAALLAADQITVEETEGMQGGVLD